MCPDTKMQFFRCAIVLFQTEDLTVHFNAHHRHLITFQILAVDDKIYEAKSASFSMTGLQTITLKDCQ